MILPYKHIVLTGASRGIGFELAQLLLPKGIKIPGFTESPGINITKGELLYSKNLSGKSILTFLLLTSDKFPKFKKIPSWIGELKKLEEIHIPSQAEVLPDEITKLVNLRILNISGKFKIFPKDIGKMINLTEIRLEGTLIKEIPENFGDLINLTELRLSNNLIEKISHSLFNLNKLEVLILSRNRLLKIPEEVGNLKSLKILDFSSNRITKIPSSCSELPLLESISFNGNQIRELPDFLSHPDPKLKIIGNQNLIRVPLQQETWICDNCGFEHILSSTDRICSWCNTSHPISMRFTRNDENQLNRLRKNAQKLKYLELDVVNLKIGNLLKSFPDLPNLLILKIYHSAMRVAILPDLIFLKFPSLTQLTLRINNLMEIPSSVNQLEKLRILSMDIHFNSSTFKELKVHWKLEKDHILKNLEFLHIASANFGKIPKSLVHCKKLKILEIDHIKKDIEIPMEIFNMSSIDKIHLPLGYSDKLPEDIKEKFKIEKIIEGEYYQPIHFIRGHEILKKKLKE